MKRSGVISRLKKMEARIKPSIPQRALIVMPEPGESDEDATDRALAEHPDGKAYRRLIEAGVEFPMIILRVNKGPVNLEEGIT